MGLQLVRYDLAKWRLAIPNTQANACLSACMYRNVSLAAIYKGTGSRIDSALVLHSIGNIDRILCRTDCT